MCLEFSVYIRCSMFIKMCDILVSKLHIYYLYFKLNMLMYLIFMTLSV